MLITLQNERKYLHQSFFQQQITHILHHHLHLKLLSFLARVYQVLVTNDGILSLSLVNIPLGNRIQLRWVFGFYFVILLRVCYINKYMNATVTY